MLQDFGAPGRQSGRQTGGQIGRRSGPGGPDWASFSDWRLLGVTGSGSSDPFGHFLAPFWLLWGLSESPFGFFLAPFGPHFGRPHFGLLLAPVWPPERSFGFLQTHLWPFFDPILTLLGSFLVFLGPPGKPFWLLFGPILAALQDLPA